MKAAQLDLFPTETHLRRIDPTKNMRRFYAMRLEPTLFGEWCLVRQWGRIGTRGQERMKWFTGPDAAHDALSKLERIKRRRGYGA